MSMHLQRDLDGLRKKILLLGSIVEEAVNKAIESLVGLKIDLLHQSLDVERRINEMEVEIEEDCLKILALHQPVAVDLRFIVAILKVNTDLERMGDLAQNIMERVDLLCRFEPLAIRLDFPRMADIVRDMLRKALNSLVKQDSSLADQVLSMDDEVDELNREMYVVLMDLMARDPDTVERAVSNISASRQLERIADLATNIAEYVIFMDRGVVVRHHFDSYRRH